MAGGAFDLLVIGAGSGGVRAARMAAVRGAKVAVAEMGPLGGTCVNAGCVPKKLLVYAASYGDELEDASGFGWKLDAASHSWSDLIAAKNHEIKRLNRIYRRLLEDAGVCILSGRARLVEDGSVQVGEATYGADKILLATGGRPSMLEVPGADLAISSDQAFHLDEMPRRVVVVGGGYIAVEFAGVFNALGAQVSLLYRGPLFLRGFDDDVRSTLADEMQKRGIDLRWNTEVAEITEDSEGLRVLTTGGDRFGADQVMLATGRAPNTADLGLEAAGVELGERGEVKVDRYFRTSAERIFAIGDCTDRVMLTPVAIAEAMALVETVFGRETTEVDYSLIPTAIFSLPNAAAVGLTEAEARSRHDNVDIYRSSFRPMRHTLSGRDEKTMMKLVVDGDSDRVLGAHMVGPEAGEIIQGLAVALNAGATKADFDRTIGIHPTAAEEFVTMRTKG